jgi:hypothetical protein
MSSNTGVTEVRQQFSLAPQNLTEAMEFAKMMAESELVPKAFKGKPGDVLIAVQMGAEIGLQAMASIQNIAVINGKPGIYGDAGKAILLANGCIIEEDDITIIKEKGVARCKITRQGRPPVERTFSIENAKTAGLWNKEGPWKTYPERQMAWRAFWFAARDAAADLLKGLGGFEELADIQKEIDVTAAGSHKEINPRNGASVAQAAQQGQVYDADKEEYRKGLIKALEAFASHGVNTFSPEWRRVKKEDRHLIGEQEYNRLFKLAEDADSKSLTGEASSSTADFLNDLNKAEQTEGAAAQQ